MKKSIIRICICVVLFVLTFAVPDEMSAAAICLYAAAFAVIGYDTVISAVRGIVRGNVFNENTLMTVAAAGAFCIGEYSEAVAVMFFYKIGELFENYAVNRSRKSISEMMNICPSFANVSEDGVIRKVDPDDVEIGDIIIVAPGERVPLDGVVINGSSYLDTSALTGEAVPRAVGEGEEILSGCINTESVLTVKVTKDYDDSTVSRVLELVENSAVKKSKSEKFITKFAKYYTPAVICAAAAVAVIPSVITKDWKTWVYRALEFLVVSCPCALVISVPISFFGGIGGAAKKGILIKGGSYLEALASVDTAVFDKTGTLTKGVFTVTKVNAVSMSSDELVRLAAAAESCSTHPAAKAICAFYGKDADTSGVAGMREIAGHGVEATVDGRRVLAGNAKLMKANSVEFYETAGGTAVYVAVDGVFAGSIVISDEIKKNAVGIGDVLKKHSVRKTYLLTGDTAANAGAAVSAAGLDGAYTDLLPSDKVGRLEEIMSRAEGRTVYAGDGINDAPVLARADVGIAMGALGSDAAIEAADVVIMNDDPSKTADAIEIAKKTVGIARENIVFSLFVKILILILCAAGAANMWAAVFADVGVMVIAVLNSFRALKVRSD